LTEAEIIAMVSNLGTAKDILEGDPSSPLAKLLQDLIQDVTDQLVQKVADYDAVASANLMQSIKPTERAYLEDDTLLVHITAPFYWKFINYGVNGRGGGDSVPVTGSPAWGKQAPQDRSFHANIMDWIRNRGISLPEAFSTYDSYAWAIMGKITRDGLKPRPFFTDVVNEKLFDALTAPISTLIGRAITVKIIEPYK
jgi:hypothetical protein